MKWLIAYSCRVNYVLTIHNALLPEELPPMNWIALANRDNQDKPLNERFLVNREYALINFWKVSDYEASKWKEDGTGYLTLAGENTK